MNIIYYIIIYLRRIVVERIKRKKDSTVYSLQIVFIRLFFSSARKRVVREATEDEMRGLLTYSRRVRGLGII